ncbi:TPA: hypothetical protein DIC20_00930 [Candidatus Dependentiae bacterium]|nr:MAG: hypothetical protein US03_C0015G0030 [candidate division TM6 bacterium GW2011_GWF2_36_131]KKQ18985.1 MAG: hypothetical protein US32_C0019G0028 [candidate division TM6 bacterium GW2011_GWA2_36_9]HBR70986.1 hypothetical protein [Candidatus Dependentiae bacterium]HCU00251.1 hypothetical protein [Candidatus Dependentiae bacterium]
MKKFLMLFLITSSFYQSKATSIPVEERIIAEQEHTKITIPNTPPEKWTYNISDKGYISISELPSQSKQTVTYKIEGLNEGDVYVTFTKKSKNNNLIDEKVYHVIIVAE